MAKTNQTAKAPKRLSGAVLIMVVTVMFVLIIMLMATLTVVSTAKNRTYTKFEENQAYYTARSALDIYVGMLGDSTHYAYNSSGTNVTYTYTDSTGTSKTINVKQGKALEMELYKITAQSGIDFETNHSPNKAYFINPVSGDGTFSDANEDNNFTVYKSVTGQPITYIEYQVTLPAVTSTSDDYGKIVDTDGSDQVATIRIEVLDRTFDNQAGYTVADMEAAVDETTTPKKSEVQASIAAGSRSKDNMRIKITSTVEFMGVEGTAVLVHDTKDPIPVEGGNAMTSLGSLDFNNMTILGGSSTRDNIAPANTGGLYGGVFAEKDYHNGNGGSSMPLGKGEKMYVGGDLTWENSPPVKTLGVFNVGDQRPYVYVNGMTGSSVTHSGSNGLTWGGGPSGTAGEKIDLITHGIKGITNDFKFNGDIYSLGNVDLSTNTNVQLSGTAYIKGNLIGNGIQSGTYYIEGKAIVNDGWFDASNNVSLPAGVTILTTAGICKSDGVTVAANDSSFHITSTFNWDELDMKQTENPPKVDADTSAALRKEEYKEEVTLVLPSLSGTTLCKAATPLTIDSPTVLSEYYSYYKIDAASAESPKNLQVAAGSYVPITAEEKAGSSADDLKNGTYTVKSFVPFGYTSVTAAHDMYGIKCISIGGTYTDKISSAPGTETDYYLVPTGAVDISQGYDFRIEGGGTVNLYLAAGGYKGQIIVEDDTTVNFYAYDSNTPTGTRNMDYYWGMKVYNRSIYDKIKDGKAISFGNAAAIPEAAPKITYYIEGSGKWETDQYTQLVGYIYAPLATIHVNTAPSQSVRWTYNDIDNGSTYMFCMGSVIAGKIDMGSNIIGVAYIDPENKGKDEGDPQFNWGAAQYTRG